MAQQDSSSEGAWPRDKLLSKRKAGHKADVFQVSPPKRMHRSVRRPPASQHLAAAPPLPAPPRSDPFVVMATNSNPFCMSLVDPFMCSSMYYDERWLDRQMAELKKWLNALLTPPSELSANLQAVQVDVVRLWNECRRKELAYAPTREKVSSMYHTRGRLDGLRRAARALFLSAPMNLVLSKVTIAVEKRKLSIRQDRDLHLDVGLQAHVMGLLLCYNPLWLRVGLEALYQQQIPLEGNSDVIGLSTFIMLRLFRDPYLQSKNKHPTVHNLYLPAYAGAIKKFTLKKFLMLVYFLDQAKAQRLIAHDPCLFCRNAPVKESREILFSFSRELLTAVGDITKYLKCLGYVVRHKQTYIDEFDYAVRDLGTDLRDGVRLARTMEIIGARDDLTRRMRVPAISRLQKIHNVKVVFESLDQAGFHIVGDIDPKDIVDGHREKTLSLLWQIIYKFQMPRFHRAAATIQAWWHSLAVTVRKRALAKQRARRAAAAARIQAWYRSLQAMWLERAAFTHKRQAATTIQRFVRIKLMMLRHRRQFLHKRQAAICIQQHFRALRAMRVEMAKYSRYKLAALTIQRHFRSMLLMRQERQRYLLMKTSATIIQQRYRALISMKRVRQEFLAQRQAVVLLQQRFRANQTMKIERNNYLKLRKSAVVVQQYFRANLAMKMERSNFVRVRKAVIKIQRWYRAVTLKRTILKNLEEHKELRRINKAATKIQSAWRGYKVRKQETARMNLIRRRSIEANNRALPNQTLGQKSVEAIEKLVAQTSMKEIIRSLTCLDFITRLCPNICVEVCDKLTKQLYIFLSHANRSVPDMDACVLSISILINLKKYPSTSKYVWKSDYVDTLLSLLMHWSDKDGLLFPYLCTLVWLLTQTPEHCKIILQESNAVKRLQKTYIQCERKQKMLKNVRNMGPSKLNIQKPGKVVYPLPALTPDWGIINDQHPRTFQSPLHGIRSIFKKLGIKVN